MERLGALLREPRAEWGLSLREVTKRSEMLAKRWANPIYASSYSQIAKPERGEQNMRVSTLISLSYLYSKRPESLLSACLPIKYISPDFSPLDVPNATVLFTERRLYEKVERLSFPAGQLEVPESTTLLVEPDIFMHRYRRDDRQ